MLRRSDRPLEARLPGAGPSSRPALGGRRRHSPPRPVGSGRLATGRVLGLPADEAQEAPLGQRAHPQDQHGPGKGGDELGRGHHGLDGRRHAHQVGGRIAQEGCLQHRGHRRAEPGRPAPTGPVEGPEDHDQERVARGDEGDHGHRGRRDDAPPQGDHGGEGAHRRPVEGGRGEGGGEQHPVHHRARDQLGQSQDLDGKGQHQEEEAPERVVRVGLQRPPGRHGQPTSLHIQSLPSSWGAVAGCRHSAVPPWARTYPWARSWSRSTGA